MHIYIACTYGKMKMLQYQFLKCNQVIMYHDKTDQFLKLLCICTEYTCLPPS